MKQLNELIELQGLSREELQNTFGGGPAWTWLGETIGEIVDFFIDNSEVFENNPYLFAS